MEQVERRNEEEIPNANFSRPTLLGRMVGSSNEGDVFVCGTKTSGLIDSVSSVTIICEQFFDSHECQPPLRYIKNFGLSVVAAHCSPVPYKGYSEVDISMPFLRSVDFTIPVLIVSDTEYNRKVPVIIGTNVKRLCKQSVPEADVPAEWQFAFNSLCDDSLPVRTTNNFNIHVGPGEGKVLHGFI